MANHERAPSPAAGQAHRLNSAASASSQPALDASSFENATSLQYNGLGVQSQQLGAYPDPSFNPADNYLLAQQGGDIAAHTFLQSQRYSAQGDTAAYNYTQGAQDHVSPGAISHTISNNDSTSFPSFDYSQNNFNESALDPSLFDNSDFKPNPADLGASLDPMATSMPPHSPTPPHLLPDMAARRQSNSPSPHASPIFQQQQSFTGANRPRNVSESLDPSSAMYPQGQQNEWSRMYGTHRRIPSDQYSDYSSHSNQASPYMPTYDNFEHSSPMLNPQQDPTVDGLGMQQFSLNENQPPPQQQYHTPGHSPHISPQLLPQQHALPLFTAENNYGLGGNQFVQNNGQEMFPPLSKPQSPSDFGAADQMSPPEIILDPAPPSMSQMPNVKTERSGEALSPPPRTQKSNRRRAVSDSRIGSRPSSPFQRGRSPSLQPQMPGGGDSLSPYDNSASRSPSPVRGREKPLSANRVRSSSHTSDQRDYILNLAEPDRTPSSSGLGGGGGKDNGRVQKHPATFQCTLCPKRFTRAYNLRSHFRTHTDERPFVCTVCGKAFARQHDRKRHEGLHSGEKKFICKGTLQSGAQWGCGRRFARADALGRHFRSEAGRVCIKPLLDEEAAERNKAWMEEQQQQQHQHAQHAQQSQQQQLAGGGSGMVSQQQQPQGVLLQPHPLDMSGNFLPHALLQQYPALAGIDWSTIPQGPPPDEEYNSRSSFEHSSGGEYEYDLSESEMGFDGPDSQMGGMGGMSQGGMGMGMGMQAQQGAQQGYGVGVGVGVYGGQGFGDGLGDFEGR